MSTVYYPNIDSDAANTHDFSVSKSSAVTEMASGHTVLRKSTSEKMGWLGSWKKNKGEKRVSAVRNHILQKPESVGYIFVADTVGLASVRLTLSQGA